MNGFACRYTTWWLLAFVTLIVQCVGYTYLWPTWVMICLNGAFVAFIVVVLFECVYHIYRVLFD